MAKEEESGQTGEDLSQGEREPHELWLDKAEQVGGGEDEHHLAQK